MASSKTWTAEDIKMGIMRLHYQTGNLSLMQDYVFVDNNGDKIEELPERSISELAIFSTLPINIQTALSDINIYLYNKALIKEDMQ